MDEYHEKLINGKGDKELQVNAYGSIVYHILSNNANQLFLIKDNIANDLYKRLQVERDEFDSNGIVLDFKQVTMVSEHRDTSNRLVSAKVIFRSLITNNNSLNKLLDQLWSFRVEGDRIVATNYEDIGVPIIQNNVSSRLN